jgi:gliding motility-associated-like protein
MKYLLQLFILLVLVILCQPKQLNAQRTGISIFCPDFSTTYQNGWQKNNDAVYTSPNILRLTPATQSQKGSAFWKQKVALSADFSFSFFFTFKISGGHADGLAFCIQQADNTAGSVGQGIGYGGIAGKSLAIEYDTYHNAPGDPNNNHIAFDYNGILHDGNGYTLFQNALPYVNATILDGNTGTALALTDGNLKYSWIDYDGTTGTLEVRISNTGSRPIATTLSIAGLNLAANFLNSDVFFGFTAATGNEFENHDIYSAYATNKYDPIIDTTLYKQGTAFINLSSSNNINNCTNPTSTITLLATDQNNNPITNTPLNISLDAGTASLSSNTVTTDNTGSATFILSNVSSANVTARVTDPAVGAFGTVTVTGINLVNPVNISIIANPADATICNGSSATLTVNGASGTNLVWNTSETATSITTSPSGTTTYTVTATDANGCTDTKSKTITVNPLPNIIITETDNSGTANDDKICIGASVTLTASGATTYSWISTESTAAITKSPAITTTYSVTGANSSGCINTATKTVVVNALPIISISPTDNSGTINNDAIICAGSSATLTASGASTYSWNSGETTTAITKSPATNSTYTVTGTDGNGCVATQNASVTVSSIPVVSLSNASFCLGSTATLNAIPLIQISVFNPGPIIPIAYTYNWTVPAGAAPQGNVPSFSTNTAGAYKVYITNTATNCQSAEVTGIVTTILPISGTTAICNGAQTQLTGSGTPATSNAWTSSNPAKATVSSTGLVTGIAVGTTNITYTNSDGCSVTALVTVNALPTISGTLSVCSSAQTQLTGSGTPATINAWASSNTATATVSSTGLVTGILAGTTTITYTNSAGCSVNAVFTVNVLPAISGTTVVCFGAQTQLTGSGTPANNNPWTSSNTANATVGNTGLVTGVLAGTSTITYTNAVGCSANAVVTVNALPVITGVLSICSGAQTQLTGSATAATVNAWTSSNTATVSVSNAGLVTGVLAGTSTITYTNSLGCSANALVTVKALPTISGVLAVCKGAQTQLTGSATAAANNAWTSSNPLIASVSNAGWVTGILAGTSTITYTNALSCSQNAVITVKALPVIDNITTNTCTGSPFSYTPPNGFNGDIVPIGTDYSWGIPIVTGAITGGVAATNLSAIEGNLVSPSNLLQAATYTVTPSAAGCVGNNFNLTVAVHPIPATPVITASGLTTFCIGGTVSLSSNAATGNQWFKNGVAINLATGTLLDVADAGSYTIVVSLNGCSSAASIPTMVTINLLPVISVNSVPANASVCAGSAASLTASGAVSYSWSGGIVNGVSFIPTQTNVYTVTGTDVNGCTNTKTATIIVNPLPPIPVVNNISYCQNDLSVSLLATPINPNIIRWYRVATGGLAIATPKPTTLVPSIDSFYVTQTNALGCESPRATLVVIIHALPIDSILTPIQNFICNGSSISLLASNNYSYRWFNNGVAITGATSNSYLAYLGGTYSFQMTSQFGCTSNSSNSKSIQLIKKPSVNFTYDSRCLNALVQFVNTSNFANSGNILWKWDFGNGSIASLKEGFYAYPAIGNYTVTLTATPSDCPLLADSIKQIFMIEAPVTGVNYGAVNAKAKVPYLLKAREIGKTYLWDPFTGLSNPASQNPTASLTAEQRYTVRITNNAGCVTQDSILVRIFNDYTVFVPSGFSPDGDGINDKLTPLLVGVREMKSFRIYNRWGQLLYQTTDKNAGWNGTYNGKQQVSETYVWVVEAIDEDGKTIQKTGKTTLIR